VKVGDLVRITYRFDDSFYVVAEKVDEHFYKLVDIYTHRHTIQAPNNCAVCDGVLHKAFEKRIKETLDKTA